MKTKRKAKKPLPPLIPGSYYYPLFEHMAVNHGMCLLDSEMEDICQVVKKLRLDQAPGPAIGPSSNDYARFMNARADLDARIADHTFNRLTGYEIWRNAWLACEAAHGIRSNKQAEP